MGEKCRGAIGNNVEAAALVEKGRAVVVVWVARHLDTGEIWSPSSGRLEEGVCCKTRNTQCV